MSLIPFNQPADLLDLFQRPDIDPGFDDPDAFLQDITPSITRLPGLTRGLFQPIRPPQFQSNPETTIEGALQGITNFIQGRNFVRSNRQRNDFVKDQLQRREQQQDRALKLAELRQQKDSAFANSLSPEKRRLFLLATPKERAKIREDEIDLANKEETFNRFGENIDEDDPNAVNRARVGLGFEPTTATDLAIKQAEEQIKKSDAFIKGVSASNEESRQTMELRKESTGLALEEIKLRTEPLRARLELQSKDLTNRKAKKELVNLFEIERLVSQFQKDIGKGVIPTPEELFRFEMMLQALRGGDTSPSSILKSLTVKNKFGGNKPIKTDKIFTGPKPTPKSSPKGSPESVPKGFQKLPSGLFRNNETGELFADLPESEATPQPEANPQGDLEFVAPRSVPGVPSVLELLKQSQIRNKAAVEEARKLRLQGGFD